MKILYFIFKVKCSVETKINKWIKSKHPTITMSGKKKSWRRGEKDLKKLFLGLLTRDVENYRVDKAIGRGKYSQVFLAKKADSEEQVVLKILKPGSQTRMAREVSILNYL